MASARIEAVYDLTGRGPPESPPLVTLWGQGFTVWCGCKYSTGASLPLGDTTAVLAIRGLVNGVEVVQSVTGTLVNGMYRFVVADAQYAALCVGDYYFEVWLYFGIAATCVVKKSVLTIAAVVPGAPGDTVAALPWMAQPAYAPGGTSLNTHTYTQTATIANDQPLGAVHGYLDLRADLAGGRARPGAQLQAHGRQRRGHHHPRRLGHHRRRDHARLQRPVLGADLGLPRVGQVVDPVSPRGHQSLGSRVA